MPHSSGGGHSSHGSHGSSRSKSNVRYGNRYYRGSNRYVYYRNGAPQYYYSDRPYTLKTARSASIKSIFTSFITAIFSAIFAVMGFFALPQKVTTNYNTDIIISDSARLLSETDKEEMNKAFLSFREKTGVTPAFFTINNKDLEKDGSTIYQYAYKLYQKTFDDEKHWLVVYSTHNDRSRWEWEGMIGDDCEKIISTDLENEFTERLQKNLKNNPEMLAASVIDAFETIGSKAGRFPITTILYIVGGIAAAGYFIYLAVKNIIKTKNKEYAEDPRINSVQCATAEAEPETAKCQFCGGEFVAGLHTDCPHCGAPVKDPDENPVEDPVENPVGNWE